MTRREALNLIRAAGYAATLVLAEEPDCEDDEFQLTDHLGCGVQISAGRDGLEFTPTLHNLDEDDYWLMHGTMTRDPVAAVRAALALAQSEEVAS